MGFLLVMDEMGMMTLSLSSSSRGSGIGGSAGLGVGGAIDGGLSCCGDGFKRGDRRGGFSSVASPGVLFRVTRLCTRFVCFMIFGAVGLLDKVGSTLGGQVSSSPTLGGVWSLIL